MSTWLWILIAVAGFIALIVILGLLMQSAEARAMTRIKRFVEDKNTDALVKLLGHWWSDQIKIGAAEGLVELNNPSTVPALFENWLRPGNSQTARIGIAEAMAKMPGDQIVPALLKEVDGKRKDQVIDLLRKFDHPEARAFVGEIDQQRNEAREKSTQAREFVKGLLNGPPEKARTTVTLPLPPEFGKGKVAGKIIGGMLTGGMMAVTQEKVTLDGYVKLPEMCALCGYLPGKVERSARCHYQIGSAAWGLTGVNTGAEAYLTYKVCTACGGIDDKAAAVQISFDRDEQKEWRAHVRVLNPEVAKQVQELNADVIASATANAAATS